MRTLIPRVIVLLLATALAAQGEPRPVGDWKGALSVAGTKLRLVLHVVREDGKLGATLDSLDQGARGIAIDAITVEGRELRFSIKALGASYAGEFDRSGDAIDGTFTQGADLPLRLERMTGTEPPEVLRRPQEPKPPFPYRVEEVGYGHVPGKSVEASFTTTPEKAGSGAIALAATLTLPKGEGPFPAAVLISGSGPQNRNEELLGHKPFLVLADHLTRNGIAVLRYDDRGVAKSTGKFGEATTNDFADDAEAGLRYLLTRAEIAPDRVGLIGHSEGGLIAPIVAARNPRVAFVVMMAGPGVTGREILLLQSELIARANGRDEASIAAAKKLNARVFAVIDRERDPAALRARLTEAVTESIDGLPESDRAQIGDRQKLVRQQIERLTSPWMLNFLRYDPRPTLARVRCPVLAINGALDLQVDPKQNLPEIEKALRKAGNQDFEVVTMPGLNHLFQRAETGAVSEYSKIEETMAQVALERITGFVRRRCGK